jgi:Pilus formation protein N terminal region
MSAVFGRRRRWFAAWAAAALLGVVIVSAPARADTIDVSVDQARLLKLPAKVATVIIGNPLIADATLQNGGVLVVTGKGYGATNLLAIDREGRVIMSKTVRVLGPSGNKLIVVYRGTERESYSCDPECQPRITLGDSAPFFNSTMAQTSIRNGQAQGGNSAPH